MLNTNTRHIVSTEDFRFALTATDKEFQRQEKKFNDFGIKRLRASQIVDYDNFVSEFNSLAYPTNPYFTIIENVEVNFSKKQGLSFSDLDHMLNFLVINSKIPLLYISNIKSPNEKEETILNHNSIWISNSEIEGFMFKCCDIFQLQFHNCNVNIVSITNASTIREIGFKKDSNIKSFQINDNATIRNVNVFNSTIDSFGINYAQLVSLTLSDTKIGSFFSNHFISDFFHFTSCKIDNISIGEFCVIKNFWVRGTTVKSIYSDHANSIGTLNVFASNIEKITYISPSTSGAIEILESTVSFLRIQNSSFTKLLLTKSEFKEILFSNCTFIIFAEINSAKCNTINFENCGFYELNLKSNLNKDNLLIFSKIKVFYLNINYFSSILGFLLLRNVEIVIPHQVKISKKSNTSSSEIDDMLSFEEKRKIFETDYNIEHNRERERLINELLTRYKKPTFILNQSSLGKAEFTDCDLANFDFQFNNSKITEIFISGGSVPSENIQVLGIEKDTLGWHEQKVSVYNQLKKVFDSQGDIFWSSHFQSKTAKHQSKVLELRLEDDSKSAKSIKEKINSLFSTNRFDWISFQLNHYSNLHGENWGRALAFTLLVPLYLYITYLLSLGEVLIPKNPINWNLVGYFFTFIDPTHKIDFLKESQYLNGWSRLLDFLSRIIVSYGIYQLIVAFRKHGKKA